MTYKKDNETGKTNFSVQSKSVGFKGHDEKASQLELQKKSELLDIVNNLDIKSPEIISAILNDEKITPDMIAEAQKQSSSESENPTE